MLDTDRIISDDEDEELRELMRQGTDDGLAAAADADPSCDPDTAASMLKTPHTPNSHTEVLPQKLFINYSCLN